jgi:hypothetical protein
MRPPDLEQPASLWIEAVIPWRAGWRRVPGCQSQRPDAAPSRSHGTRGQRGAVRAACGSGRASCSVPRRGFGALENREAQVVHAGRILGPHDREHAGLDVVEVEQMGHVAAEMATAVP